MEQPGALPEEEEEAEGGVNPGILRRDLFVVFQSRAAGSPPGGCFYNRGGVGCAKLLGEWGASAGNFGNGSWRNNPVIFLLVGVFFMRPLLLPILPPVFHFFFPIGIILFKEKLTHSFVRSTTWCCWLGSAGPCAGLVPSFNYPGVWSPIPVGMPGLAVHLHP